MAKKDDIATASEITSEFQYVCDVIEHHRTCALVAVNQEHLLTCWEVGGFVFNRIKSGKWGDKVVRALADYIKRNRPDMKGYSKSNLYNMVRFYEQYSSLEFLQCIDRYRCLKDCSTSQSTIVQPMAGQLTKAEIVQPAVGQMPGILQLVTYSHHTIILNSCRRVEERLFYILYANHERLNKRELERVIKTDTFSNLLGGDAGNMSEVFSYSKSKSA